MTDGQTGVPGEGRLIGGRYRLGRLLGTGGMADVYDALDERLGRPVAVKLLKVGLATDQAASARFASEARSAAKLSHPNVVGVFDTGEDDGLPWLVMERLPGRSLADELSSGHVDQGRLRGWILETLSALGAAHAAGIVHRDMKPGNILITEDGHAKVADFGIAKSIESSPGDIDLTSTGMLLGTPAYLAPERIDGSPATPRSDLYAVGVVLWEALVGRKPFDGKTPLAIAANVRNEPVPLVGTMRADADPRLAAAADRAMSKDPNRRPATADDMAAIITGAAPTVMVGSPTVAVPAPAQTVAMTRPTVRPAPVPMTAATPARSMALGWPILAGILLFLILLVAALLIMNANSSSNTTTAETTLPSVTSSSASSTTKPVSTTAASPNAGVVKALRDEAGRLDGRRGSEEAAPDVAKKLREMADKLEDGKDVGDDATSLRKDLPELVNDKKLTNATAKEVDGVLARVPGVGAAPTTTQRSTTTVESTSTTDPVVSIGGDGKPGKGKGSD